MTVAIESQPQFAELLRFVSERTGLICDSARRSSVEAAIQRAMQQAGVADVGEYLERVCQRAEVFDDLTAELTVGETYFFRDDAQFGYLRERIIPAISCERPAGPIRAWSAGCASGEEAYSLAILLQQAGRASQSRILATDISQRALSRARRAEYREWSLRERAADAARPYLQQHGDGRWRLDERIRRMVDFQYLNLALDRYPSFATQTAGLDLIFCRNVLIYFDGATVRRVAEQLHQCLRPGGWLLTGPSDPLLTEFTDLEIQRADGGTIYRRADHCVEQVRNDAHPEPTVESVPPRPVARIASPPPPAAGEPSADEAALRIRRFANVDVGEAEASCATFCAQFPTSVELHYLHAVLLLELKRPIESAAAARRALFLDRSLAVGHLTMGVALEQSGDRLGAQRAYENARRLCEALPAAAALELADGETAARMALAAASRLRLLSANGSVRGADA